MGSHGTSFGEYQMDQVKDVRKCKGPVCILASRCLSQRTSVGIWVHADEIPDIDTVMIGLQSRIENCVL